MSTPTNLKYSKDHEWVSATGGTTRVGITDFAQHELGDVVFCELPEVGRVLKKGEAFAVVESVKAASDVYAPVSGKVVKRNDSLTSNPELLNTSPYESGWMIEIEATDSAELGALMDSAAYDELLKGA